jgi:hypothetical protein
MAGQNCASIYTPSNKGMKQTKLSAAPLHGRFAWLSFRCRRMPAPVNGMDAGTASQLIPGVLRTTEGREMANYSGWKAMLCSVLLAIFLIGTLATQATAQTASAPNARTCPWPASLDAPVAAPENHKVIFENERVRVLDVIVGVGGRETLHAHCWPSILYVTFRGKLREWGADGKVIREVKETPPATAFPLTQWLEASPPHSIENLDSQPIHLVRIELKQ